MKPDKTREKAGHVVFPKQVVLNKEVVTFGTTKESTKKPTKKWFKRRDKMRDICVLFVYVSPSQNISRYSLPDSNTI